jgi:ribosomal peptide maturation radical SAM protein 1
VRSAVDNNWRRRQNAPLTEEILTHMKIALVVMPFAAAHRPSLAVGLLQAALRRRAIECDAFYFNVMMDRLLDRQTSEFFATGQRFSNWDSYQREVLDHPVWGVGQASRAFLVELLEMAPLFLRLAFESRKWGDYDLVGFTSTFEQTMPSLCLARMIRAAHPHVLIALGGANFEADMGQPYLEQFDFVDFVSTAEADVSFPQLCANLQALKEGRAPQLEVPAGILYRDEGIFPAVAASSPEPVMPVVMDDLPTPDYADFFREARQSEPQSGDESRAWQEWVPIEASRGCWWGQKAHCTFCGLNGETMTFRRKSWSRVVQEIAEMVDAYGCTRLQFTDNILGMEYFHDLLPYWAERGDATCKYFEVKSNLRRSQLEMLSRAGVTLVQPGIESLSDTTLRLMRKGVSAAQNIAFMRWCAELGITSLWNILFAFPGEPLEDFPAMLALLRKITHLPAPTGIAPIRMDRFSPNYTRWKELGFARIAPMPAYRHIFPFDGADLERLAYYFTYEHDQFDASLAAARAMENFGNEWRASHDAGTPSCLEVVLCDGQFVLADTRFNMQPSRRELRPDELALLLACDAPATPEAVLRAARADLDRGGWTSAIDTLALRLAALIDRDEIAQVSGHLVTLVTMPNPVRERAATWKEGAFDVGAVEVPHYGR